MANKRGAFVPYQVPPDQQVLVALMNNKRDFAIARDQGWYRIPVKSAPRAMVARHIAFYQTKIFGDEGWAINYWAEIKRKHIVKRLDLFPDQPGHARADKEYYRLEISELQKLKRPIVSHRGRRIIFIPTTLKKFQNALEINDLFHESPLEDQLWEVFKSQRIEAERQYYLNIHKSTYCLDFALFCGQGHIDIECDGDTWHAQPARIPMDNARDNALTTQGWSVLRFNSRALHDDMPDCMHKVRETINQRGGLVTATGERRWAATGVGQDQQLSLFEPLR
jgi:very-short-patch-repair endonuclease